MNSVLIKGNPKDIEEFACLLEKEGRKRSNKDKNAVCLVTYEKSKDINLFNNYNSWLGSSNKVLFTLPGDKAKAYKHLFDKELVKNTPKFKVGDVVNLIAGGKIHCNPHQDDWEGASSSDLGKLEGKILKIYNRPCDNITWYNISCSGNWRTAEALELVKEEKLTNMNKYKVIKWYPGCEGQEGEVISTSKDYSTQEYKEFYEEVKVDTLQDLLKNCKFKVGDTLPTLLLGVNSTYSTNGISLMTLDSNVGFQASTILEFTLINNKAYFRTFRKNDDIHGFYFEVSILESIERTEYVNWSLSKDRNSVRIGCQKYTKEDCLSFLNTLARTGQESMIFKYGITEVPVSYADIIYVYCLLKDN